MKTPQHRPPRSAVKGTAIGLIMMTFFTLIWSGIAYGGFAATPYWPFLFVFAVPGIIFIVNAVKLFKLSRVFPPATSPEDMAREKNTGKWFGIIFGAEGLGIFIAINVVVNIGHPELEVPAIALVVGLHFFPLAKVFRRTVDYYFASYSTLIALAAMYLALNKTMSETQTIAFTGVGLALATTGYGIYMILTGRQLKAKYVDQSLK